MKAIYSARSGVVHGASVIRSREICRDAEYALCNVLLWYLCIGFKWSSVPTEIVTKLDLKMIAALVFD